MADAESETIQDQSEGEHHSNLAINYRGLFHLGNDPMVVLDAEGGLAASNRMAQELLGPKPGAVRSLIAEQFSPKADSVADEALSEFLRDVQEMGSARWQFRLPETNRVFGARLSYLPVELIEGGGFLWTAHEVTEWTHLEESRQELVNMLVHDLRVPLSNIQSSLDLVLTAWRERDVTLPMEQLLQIGQRSAQRMEHLISDILDSARLQAHERTLTVTPIDVATLVEEAVEIVTGSAQRRRQKLQVAVEPDLPPMEGDLELLRRVLVNLLGNAVKYTDEGGEITITATLNTTADDLSADEYAAKFQFSIHDTGPGIAPRVQERLFQLFYRGDSTKIKSTGIGLAFCKLAVEAHGGRIWVESTPGSGSTFRFTIPRPLPRHTPYYQEGG